MTREEYLIKHQRLQERLQEEKLKNGKAMETIEDEHREKVRAESDRYREQVAAQRETHRAAVRSIEHEIHDLKIQWVRERPADEAQMN